jgi:YesN/AraC family two-component response regulator
MTVHTEAPIVKRAAKLGVEAYVVKPVQKKQLEARILTVLENTAARRT